MDLTNNRLLNNIVRNLGKRNYEKRLKENPEEYALGYNSPKKIKQLIKEAEEYKTNIYKGYKIPMQYKNKLLNEYLKNNNVEKTIKGEDKDITGVTLPYKNIIKEKGRIISGDPIIRFFKNLPEDTVAISRYTIGHELGHAKNMYDRNSLLKQIKKEYKNGNTKQANKLKIKLKKLIDDNQKINTVNGDNIAYREELADKNVSKFLKQTGIPKKDRRAIYYIKKNLYQSNGNRYTTKNGNLKYLKDYLFGFSNNKNDYYFLAREYLKSIHLL